MRVPRLWVLPLGIMAGVSLATFAGALSTAVLLDMVAWWPVWLGLGAAWLALRAGSNGRVRPGGLVALMAAILLGVFLLGHVEGWPVMPSASQRLVGPMAEGVDAAALEAVIHGRVVVGEGPEFLYVVRPVRWGGEFGLPRAVEESTTPEAVLITFSPPASPGLQSFAGWDIVLASGPIWELDLGGSVTADLSSLTVSVLTLTGSGEAVLGDVEFRGEVTVSGSFQLSFPAGAAVMVVGEAAVPEGWIAVEGGVRSPVEGDGWVVSTSPGSSLVITTR